MCLNCELALVNMVHFLQSRKDHPTPCHTTPKHDVGYPSGLEYMQEALQESQVPTCGNATPLGAIEATDIAIVMPNTTYSHAQSSPQGFPFLLAVPVCSGASH